MSNAAENIIIQPEGYASELGELNEVEAALAELRAKYGNVPDYATKDGYTAGKKAIRELTRYRTGTDKARLAITKPHREFIEQVNTYAKGLITEVEKLEQPHRDAKQEVDQAEERKKEERIAKLRDRLAKEVTSYLDTAAGLDSSGLAELIDATNAIDTEGYFDITKEAEDEKARVVRELKALHDQTLQREVMQENERAIAAERAELERERAELAKLRAEREAAQQEEDKKNAAARRCLDATATAVPPQDVADAGELVKQHQEAATAPSPADPLTEEESSASPFGSLDEPDAFGDALADLQAAGLEVSQAVAVLSAIQSGSVRNVAFIE